MKNTVLFTAILIALAITSHATVWRINNIPGTDADFTTAQLAHNNQYVMSGDTLYFEPSSGSYGDLALTKKLIIIGNGYWPEQNPETQANINFSELGKVTFNPGSQGSIIQGCRIFYVIFNTSEILIQRNYIYNTSSSSSILFNTNDISDIIIRNNFILNTNSTYQGSSVISCSKTGVNNIIISNNYIASQDLSSNHNCLYLASGFTGVVENNVIYGLNTVYNSQFNNNILREGTFLPSNTTYYNNIGNSTQFGTVNGNKSNVSMLNVFVGVGSTDGQWQLKAGSPAIGAGVGGIDCGMFGGDFPYVLSGIPAIPSVYEFSHDMDYDNQIIEVEISVKSHN